MAISIYMDRWRLFAVIVAINSAAVLAAIPIFDLSSLDGALAFIRHTVRCSIPVFILTFVASSLATLWPNKLTRWLLVNRRYVGLAFAAAFSWQLVAIAWLSNVEPGFLTRTLGLKGLVGGSGPYVVLAALVLTSFRPVARIVSAANWRRLHKAGMYVFWFFLGRAYVLPSPSRPELLRYVVLATFALALLLRVAAWAYKRWRKFLAEGRASPA